MRSPVVPLGIAMVFGIAACSDQSPPGPSGPEFTHVVSSTCDFSAIHSGINQYFSPSDKSIVQGLKDLMQASHDIGVVRDRGFDILSKIEGAVNAGTAGFPSVGSRLAHDLLECMYTSDDLPDEFPDEYFVEELTPLASGGLGAFGVRAGTEDPASPVFARDGFSGIAPPPDYTWAQVLSGRVLLYGSRDLGELAYDWDPIPTSASYVPPNPVIGLCTTEGSTSLVQHNETTILGFVDPDYFLTCSPPSFTTVQTSAWAPGSLVRQLVSVISPRPLHAAVAFAHTSSGGALLRSHFDVEPVPQILLEIIQQPPSSFTTKDEVTVRVKATATVMTPPNQQPELQPFSNATLVLETVTTTTKGTNVVVSGNTAVTVLEEINGEDVAVATFKEKFNKTGVYKQVVTVAGFSLDDFRTTQIVTDTTSAFNVKGK